MPACRSFLSVLSVLSLAACGTTSHPRQSAQAICDTTLAWVGGASAGSSFDDLATLQRAALVTAQLQAADEPQLTEQYAAVAAAMERGDRAAIERAAAAMSRLCRRA